jgi:hypothetical protein
VIEKLLLAFTWLWRKVGLPVAVIHRDDDNGPYLERYHLIRTRWFGCYLHRFHRSDPDGFHDHPWPFLTVLLTHPYVEHTLHGLRTRMPLRPYVRGIDSFHRVELFMPGRTWTLFFHGPVLKKWGFLPEGARILYTRYNGPSSYELGRMQRKAS